MEYNFKKIEERWQAYWAEHKSFRAENASEKSKYYVLDMFPYPSGAGLHVGHPLGYIASDIIARYKRLKGFNVLHPMGYDSFGLPAEQYAIQTGQHPAITTEQNIKRYREQLDKLGFSFDWEREVKTSDPNYYKWTQWIFIQLFNSWYNPETDKAEPIEKLVEKFNVQGSKWNVDGEENKSWGELNEKEKSDVLMNYRLAYLSETYVNWCPQLGTVLANEEVKDGVSERGGYPVERKLMPQWSLRITAYAERLLNDLNTIDWSESIKEAQRNWIGRSEGTSLKFSLTPNPRFGEDSGGTIEVFTTRPDTIFGVSFLTLAPEHEFVEMITTPQYEKAVDEYILFAKNRSERERQADVKKITGQFTGAYAIHPFSGKKIPIWIGDYVLAGYGTGAVMAVPAHDARDYAFAKHFNLPFIKVIEPPASLSLGEGQGGETSYDEKEGKCINSDFLNGLEVKDAIKKAIAEIEKKGLGKGKINYRLRDAIFGRQRYWGEPIPVYYKNGIPFTVDEKDLPLKLPEVDKYLPTEDGEPPLARAKNWNYSPLPGRGDGGEAYPLETTTMPGWAGSSWYYLRYMDPHNNQAFVSKEAVNYWKDVDLYIGGAEHATGHLLYVRFWTKFLNDLNLIPVIEPVKKLINQGMIQGISQFAYRLAIDIRIGGGRNDSIDSFSPRTVPPVLISKDLYEKLIADSLSSEEKKQLNAKLNEIRGDLREKFPNKKGSVEYTTAYPIHVDVNIVSNSVLNIDAFKRDEFANAKFIPEDEKYICGSEVEKMSKSKLNVVTPDVMVEQYGADCLRLYEMFLGPLEQHKPWNTNGITGVFGFLKKLWRLYHSPDWNTTPLLRRGDRGEAISDEQATKPELKTLHKTIKKITEDIDRFSFNTSVSNFMICVNELTDLKCNKRAILEPLAIIIAPYAPHMAEELWSLLGHKESITYAKFPEYKEEYLVESSFNYPISVNGKTRFFHELDLSLTKENIEKEVMTLEQTKKYLEGKSPKKVIVVLNKIVNIVV